MTLVVRIYDLFLPYGWGILYAGSTSFWHITGENLLKYGYWDTLFTPILNTGSNLDPLLYINHPSLLSVYLSIFYKLFGSSEIVTKLAALIAWYLVSYLIFLVAKKQSLVFGHYALIASLIIPFTNRFACCADSIGGPLIVVFSVLLIYVLETKRSSWIIFLTVLLGTFSEWTFLPLLFSCFFMRQYKSQRLVLIFSTFCSVCFLVGSYFIAFYRSVFGFQAKGVKVFQSVVVWLMSEQGISSVINKIESKLSSRIHSPKDQINIFKWICRVGFQYILNLFTPLIYPSIVLFIKKTRFKFLPFIIQSFVAIFVFANGSYRHSFWSAPLVPLASLAIGFFMYRFKKWTNLVILFSLILSTGYTIIYKNRHQTNYFSESGKFINKNSLKDEIVLIKPITGHDDRGEKLLLGWYSKRDIIFVQSEDFNTKKISNLKKAHPKAKFKFINIEEIDFNNLHDHH